MIDSVRLLMVTFDPPQNIGGVEGRAVHYTRQLLAMGHFVEVVTLSPDFSFTSEDFEGTVLHKLPSSVSQVPKALRFIMRTIIKDSIDSVFLLSGGMTLLGAGILASSRMLGVRTLTFFYGKELTSGSDRPVSLFVPLACVLSTKVAVNSRYTAGLLPLWVRVRAEILHPGVDPGAAEGFVKRPNRNEMNVLFVGRLVQRKGLDTLLLAFCDVVKKIPNLRLVVVGDGPDREHVRSMVDELGLASKVTMTGALRGEALYHRFAGADLFVMTPKTTKTDVEGFGTVFIEAGLFGLPVIGFELGWGSRCCSGLRNWFCHSRRKSRRTHGTDAPDCLRTMSLL